MLKTISMSIFFILLISGCSKLTPNPTFKVADNTNYLTNDDYAIVLEKTLKEISNQVDKSDVCDFTIDYRSIILEDCHYMYIPNSRYKYILANYFYQDCPENCLGVINEFNSKFKITFNKNLSLYIKGKQLEKEKLEYQRQKQLKIQEVERQKQLKIQEIKLKEHARICKELETKIRQSSGSKLIKLYSKKTDLGCE